MDIGDIADDFKHGYRSPKPPTCCIGSVRGTEAYVNEEFEDYYASEEATQFATQVFTNNIRVGFTAFSRGTGSVAICEPAV